jgi:3-oxoacyl-[acyl-carrier protein] reductase
LSASTLEGRVAIVTGAGGGVGGGICSALVSAGAAVAAVDIKRDKAERVAESVSRNGARCVALETDVSDRSSVEGMVERVAGELGVWTSW